MLFVARKVSRTRLVEITVGVKRRSHQAFSRIVPSLPHETLGDHLPECFAQGLVSKKPVTCLHSDGHPGSATYYIRAQGAPGL